MGSYWMKKCCLYIGLVLLFTLTPIKNFIVMAEDNDVMTPKNEMRAAWISTVVNIDLQPGMNESEYRSWVESTVKMLKEKNFNTIIFQVKPTSDALYPSELAPWSKYITGGKQGTDPGYDPLQIMLDTAHEHGLELHAWINPYRVTMASDELSDLDESNIAIQHEEWVVKHGAQYYLDPGIPEVSEYLVDTVEEIVTNYDVDAVHMDDYFYPGIEFEDEDTFATYGGDFEKIEDWRRNNVNQLVANINERIKQLKPWVQFGISPSGIWRNDTSDSTGSATAGSEHYDNLFADSRQWIIDGSIDYITPQIYWSRELAIARYDILAEWWGNQVEQYANTHPVNLYIGMADYKVAGGSEPAFDNPREIVEQILDNRKNNAIKGQMHFTLRDIKNNLIQYQDLISEEAYHYKALTPQHTWNGNSIPLAPSSVQIVEGDSEVYLSIYEGSENTRKYVVYRFPNESEINYNDPNYIVDILYNDSTNVTFVDSIETDDENVIYGIKSLSYTGVESEEAIEITFPMVEVDKDVLIDLIDQVDQLHSNDYTSDSWNELVEVLEIANGIIQNEEATQEDVDQTVEELEKRIKSLVIDKTALAELINELANLNSEDYTNESWATLETALEQGSQVLENNDMSVDDVQKAMTQLEEAVNALVEIENVDKSELETVIQLAKGKKKDEYEKNSWRSLEEALQYAKVVLEDEHVTIEDVQKAVNQLETAIQKLKKITNNKKKEVSTKKKENIPQQKKSDYDEAEDGTITTGSAGKELPKTASPTYNILLTGIGLLFAGMIILFLYNKRSTVFKSIK